MTLYDELLEAIEANHALFPEPLASKVLAVLNLRGAHHCPTCQCARLSGVAPVPDNKHSRSWHDNALEKGDARPDQPARTE